MAKRLRVGVLAAFALLGLVRPAWAPFHVLVIEQIGFGPASVPDAQYVQLRTLAAGQVFVGNQSFPVQNADGASAGSFGRFDRFIALQNGEEGVAILAGTAAARDVFCIAFDQIVDGRLPFPDGRVCFGNFAGQPVDCVAYGNYTGDALPHAPATARGMALVRVSETNNNADDFVLLDPTPENNAGELGRIEGVAGDADGSGFVEENDIGETAAVLFAHGSRCELDPETRGADANVDTRVNAADLVATIGIVGTGVV
jgi:hypothetical protein